MADNDCNYVAHATSIPDLIEVCCDLGKNLSDILDLEEKKKCIKIHIEKYVAAPFLLPEFPKNLDWVNVSNALTVEENLTGKVVILDFFTYCCINCLHVLPQLAKIEEKYTQEGTILIVGVHSAKFDNEKSFDNLSNAVKKYNISHPVLNDTTCKLWTDMQIFCWPTILIVGPSNEFLFALVGENNEQLLHMYVDVTVEYFNELGSLCNKSIPLMHDHFLRSTIDQLYYPGKIACYENGIILSDSGNNRIIVSDFHGNVQLCIGNIEKGYRDGSFKDCLFNNPQGVAYYHPNIFIADTGNHCIRQADLYSRTVSTTISNSRISNQNFEPDEVLETNQMWSSPWDVCLGSSLDKLENAMKNVLFVAMAGSHQIWGYFLEDGILYKNQKYYRNSFVCLAGSGKEENRNTSYPHMAGFAQPSGIAFLVFDGEPCLFIADAESSSVRRFNLSNGSVSSVVGGAKDPSNLFAFGDKDGIGNDGLLQHPLGIAAYKNSIYIADTYNHKVKIIKKSGNRFKCDTVAGSGFPGNKTGCIEVCQFNEPNGLCSGYSDDVLYISDTNNHSVKVFDLINNLISELSFTFSDKTISRKKDFENEQVIFVPYNEDVKVLLKVRLLLAHSLHLNHDAPNVMMLSTESKFLEHSNNEIVVLTEDTEVLIKINSFTEDNSPHLLLKLSAFLCSDNGYCVKKIYFKCLKFCTCEDILDRELNVEVILKD